MAEIAGLVLGAIPVALLVLDYYANTLGEFHNDRIVIGTLQASLALQQRRLKNTLERIGLDNPSNAELEECLKRQFPDSADDLFFIIRKIDASISDLLANLRVDRRGKVRISKPEMAPSDEHI
jgi:hypothetical protein